MEISNEENNQTPKENKLKKAKLTCKQNFWFGFKYVFFHENIEVGGSSVKLGSLVQASFKLES